MNSKVRRGRGPAGQGGLFLAPPPSKPSISSGHAGATFKKRGRPLSSGLHVVKCGRTTAVEFAKRAPVHAKLLMCPFQSLGPSPGLDCSKVKSPPVRLSACPLRSCTTPRHSPSTNDHHLHGPHPSLSFCDKLPASPIGLSVCAPTYLRSPSRTLADPPSSLPIKK